MMNRLIAILLMPLFVVGNSFVHSHCSAAHPANRDGRSHFHTGSAQKHGHHHQDSHAHANHHHHGHHHRGDDHREHDADGHAAEGHAAEGHAAEGHAADRPESVPVAPDEHDSDAVYVVAVDFVCTACDRVSIEIDSRAFVGTAISSLVDFRLSALRDRPPHATVTPRPLYLLHAAFRL